MEENTQENRQKIAKGPCQLDGINVFSKASARKGVGGCLVPSMAFH